MLLLNEKGDDIDLTHIRELRLWHWQQSLSFRSKQDEHEKRRSPNWVIDSHRVKANFHLGAVQALNDLFPIGDTAEKDDRRGGKKK